MRQKLFILITLLSVSLYANAQEYRLAKSSGTLKLSITGVIVEGYEGKDIIFSGQKVINEETTDERAKGLVPISSSKYVDNTGMGISVIENGQDVNVNLVSKKPIGILTVKVPNNIKISILNNNTLFYSYTSSFSGGFGSSSRTNTENTAKTTDETVLKDEIVLKNLKNEIEVSVYSSKIRLENNSGPMSIKTVSGSVDAIFSGEIKGPVSIISVTNYVDITLPASTKANIEMSSNYGKLFAGKEFKIELDKEVERSVYNLRTSGDRYGNIIPGAITIGGDKATSVSGIQTRTKATTATTSKPKTDEVVVTGYGTSAVVSTKENAKVKDTVNMKAITVNGVQINGNIAASTKSRPVNSIQITNDGVLINSDGGSTGFPARVSYSGFFSGGDRIKGKLNGGGVDLIFKSTNKNVYLRQQ